MNTQVKCVVLSLHLPHPPGVLDKQKSWLMHWFDSIHYFIPFLFSFSLHGQHSQWVRFLKPYFIVVDVSKDKKLCVL